MTRPFTIDLAWGPLLGGLGLTAADVLRQARLPHDLFEQSRPTLPAQEFFRLFEVLVRSSYSDAPALELGRMVSPEAFSPPLFAAYCSPNARVAMTRLASYKPLIGPVVLEVADTAEGLEVCVAGQEGLDLPVDYIVTELVFLFELVARATRFPIRARRVEMRALPHQTVALQMYGGYFGCKVVRGPCDRIVFWGVDAERPFVSANKALFQAFEPELQARLDDLAQDATLKERVRAALVEAIPGGTADIGSVASALAMSRRTLQRRLTAEGLTFQGELAHVRERLARDYLARTSYTSAEISYLLGYESPNSFIRAFHGWTGTTPEAARLARA